MSYILDALNKSEQERSKQDDVTGLQGIPKVTLINKPYSWAYPMLFLLTTMFALAMGYFLASSNHQASRPDNADRVDTMAINSNTLKQRTAFEDHDSKPLDAKQTSQPHLSTLESAYKPSPSSDTAKAAVTYSTSTQPATSQVPHVSELLPSLQASLPDINYSAHVYSDTGSAGFVILNGSKRYRGYRVTQNLHVKEVLPEGVILEYQGVQFRLSAMKSWHQR